MCLHKITPLLALFSTLVVSCDRKSDEGASRDKDLESQRMHARFSGSPENILDHRADRYVRVEPRPDLEAFYEAFIKGEDAMVQHIHDLLAKDEQAALDTMADLQADLDYRLVGMTLFNYYKDKEDLKAGLGAFEILNRNPTLATPLLREFVSTHWDKEPEDAMKWVHRHPTFNGIEAATHSIGQKVGNSKNPAAGIQEMLDESIPDSVRSFYIAGAVENWAKRDMNAAFEYMSQVKPHPAYDETYYSMVGASAGMDPESAMEWANLITDYGLKTSAIAEVKSFWERSDPDGFGEWQGGQSAAQ